MGCTNTGHCHSWPNVGVLVIQRCENRCNFCEGEAAKKPWKYAWFLRRHVRAVHHKEYPFLRVDKDWTDEEQKREGKTKSRGKAKAKSKSKKVKEESPEWVMPKGTPPPLAYIAPAEYGKQYPGFQGMGQMIPQAFIKPDPALSNGDNSGSDEFDFSQYASFPAFGDEAATLDPAALQLNGGEPFDFASIDKFLFEATGGEPLSDSFSSDTFSADEDGERQTGFISEIIDEDEDAATTAGTDTSLLDTSMMTVSGGTHHNTNNGSRFFMSPCDDTAFMSDRPLADIFGDQYRIRPAAHDAQRLVGLLSMTAEQFLGEGMDAKAMIPCVEMFARSLARNIEMTSQSIEGAQNAEA